MHEAEYNKPKTWIQTSNKTQPQWTQTEQGNWQMKISVELGTKTKTNYKAHKNSSRATWNLIPLDKRLVPDLLRGRGRSIGGNLNVGEEGYKQMIVTLQSLHHSSVSYQHVHTWVDITKKAYPCKCNWEQKQEHERMQLNMQMNVLAHEYRALQTIGWRNYSCLINLSKTHQSQWRLLNI
jgi:hypothetical protein